MGATKLAINRPIAILMLVTAFVILGLVAYSKLPAELNPKVEFPDVTVTTTYAGTNPQEMETLITKPVEDSLAGVSGLKEITSTSQQGVSVVSCEFYLGTDLDTAAADVLQKVNAARRKLPTEADSPSVVKADNTAQPILYIAMRGNRSPRELRILADNVVSERLQQAPDVSAVNVYGGDQREIRVSVRQSRLAAYGITISQLATAINNANTNVSAGYIQTAQQFASIRFLGEFASVDEIKNLRLSLPTTTGGAAADSTNVVRLGDIADVQDTTVQRVQSSTLDGKDSVTLAIQKTSDGNTLNAIGGVKKQMEAVKKFIPADVGFVITRDDSVNVHDNLKDVVISLCLGALLAVGIVFLFLHNVRATIIIAIAIPVCLIATFLPISIFGFTLNTLTLLGLSLAIGILIDDSIVVLENIVRHLRMGQEPREAAITGRTEIGLAALTLTAVDLVVFIPIAGMGGIIGEFFRSFGATISIAVLFSLFVSFTLTPMLASRWFKKGEELESTGQGRRGFFAAFDRGYGRFEKRYEHLLARAIRNPWPVFLLGTLLLVVVMASLGVAGSGFKATLKAALPLVMQVGVLGLVVAFWNPIRNFFARLLRRPANGHGVSGPALLTTALAAGLIFGVMLPFGMFGHQLGFRFAPGQDQNQVAVAVEAPAGSSLAYTRKITNEVERRIRADKKITPEIKYLLTSVGRSQAGGAGSGNQGTQYANVQVSLYEKAAPLDAVTGFFGRLFHQPQGDPLRAQTDADIAEEVRKLVKDIPGAKIQANEVNGFGGGGAPLEIDVVGTDFNQLLSASNKIKNAVGAVSGVYNTDLSFKASQPEVQVRLDRVRAAQYGLNVNTVAQVVADALQGNTVAQFRDPVDSNQYNINVQLAPQDRSSTYTVGQIPVAYQGGNTVRLGDVANITLGAGPTRVDRLNRLRQVAVTAYLMPGTQIGNVRQKVDPVLTQMANKGQLGNVSYQWGGEAQTLAEEFPYLITAVTLGIVLSYMLMAALFNNLLYPLSVMLTMPQALVGALLALFVSGQPFSLIAAIGVVMLNGVATKNAILMVDYTNTLRRRGYTRGDAIREAAPTRLRPILMTSLAIVGATLPTALALGRGAGFRQPLGITVVGGVIVSTMLTLFVVPCAYEIFDNFSDWVGRIRNRRAKSSDILPPGPHTNGHNGNGHAPNGAAYPANGNGAHDGITSNGNGAHDGTETYVPDEREPVD